MDLNAPNLSLITRQADDLSQIFRVNQRFSAEVMQVQGERVVLSIQGIQIVARLSGTTAATELADRRFAQFQVKEASQNNITVQIIPSPVSSPQPGAQLLGAASLAPRILSQLGLVTNEETLNIANALLNHGLPVTPEMVDELQSVLSSLGTWSGREADMAATIKSMGLPLTPGSLQLALNFSSLNISGDLKNLQVQLAQLFKDHPALTNEIQAALQFLDSLAVNWDQHPETLSDNLRQVIVNLNTSLESKMAELLQKGGTISDSNLAGAGILSLVKLRQSLANQGMTDLSAKIDHFIEGLRLTQYVNLDQETINPNPTLTFEIPLRMGLPAVPGSPQNAEYVPARMKVAFKHQGSGRKVDPNYTHMVIQVEIAENQAMQVDLSVVQRQIVALVSSPNNDLDEIAREEFPNLVAGLSGLGFNVKGSRFEIHAPLPITPLPEDSPKTNLAGFHAIDMEI
ncbi:MAG TPA: hypothetical protein VIO61_15295 [Anaerolineaceae bacterium]